MPFCEKRCHITRPSIKSMLLSECYSNLMFSRFSNSYWCGFSERIQWLYFQLKRFRHKDSKNFMIFLNWFIQKRRKPEQVREDDLCREDEKDAGCRENQDWSWSTTADAHEPRRLWERNFSDLVLQKWVHWTFREQVLFNASPLRIQSSTGWKVVSRTRRSSCTAMN